MKYALLLTLALLAIGCCSGLPRKLSGTLGGRKPPIPRISIDGKPLKGPKDDGSGGDDDDSLSADDVVGVDIEDVKDLESVVKEIVGGGKWSGGRGEPGPTVDLTDKDKKVFIGGLYEEVQKDCSEISDTLPVCSPESERMLQDLKWLKMMDEMLCESTSSMSNCDEDNAKDAKAMDYLELFLFASRKKKPSNGRDKRSALPDLECYPSKICDELVIKMDNLENDLEDLEDEQGECQRQICTVEKEDFEKFLEKTTAEDGSDVLGFATVFVASLGRRRISDEELDTLTEELGLSSRKRGIVKQLIEEGEKADVSDEDKEEVFDALFDLLQEECTEHAPKKASECSVKAIDRVFVLQSKHIFLHELCESSAADCSDKEEGRVVEALGQIKKKLDEEDTSKSPLEDVLAELPKCKPNKLCETPTAIEDVNDNLEHCRPKVCDVSRDDLPIYIYHKLSRGPAGGGRGSGGGGGERPKPPVTRVIQHLKDGEDVDKRVVELFGFDEDEEDTLKDLLDGKKVNEDDMDQVLEVALEKLREECDKSAPSKGGEVCTKIGEKRDESMDAFGEYLELFCQRDNPGEACANDGSDQEDLMDDLKDFLAAIKEGDLSAKLKSKDWCYSPSTCRFARGALHSAKESFCRSSLCDIEDKQGLRNFFQLKLSQNGDGGGESGGKPGGSGAGFASPFSLAALLNTIGHERLNDRVLDSLEKRFDLDANKLADVFDPDFEIKDVGDLSKEERKALDEYNDALQKECELVDTAADTCSRNYLRILQVQKDLFAKICLDDSLDGCSDQGARKTAQVVEEWFEQKEGDVLGLTQISSSTANRRRPGERGGSRVKADGQKLPEIACKPEDKCAQLETSLESLTFGKDRCRPKACDVRKKDFLAYVVKLKNQGKEEGPGGAGGAGGAGGVGGVGGVGGQQCPQVTEAIRQKSREALEKKKKEWQERQSKQSTKFYILDGKTCDDSVQEDDDSRVMTGVIEMNNECERLAKKAEDCTKKLGFKICRWSLNKRGEGSWKLEKLRCSITARRVG